MLINLDEVELLRVAQNYVFGSVLLRKIVFSPIELILLDIADILHLHFGWKHNVGFVTAKSQFTFDFRMDASD